MTRVFLRRIFTRDEITALAATLLHRCKARGISHRSEMVIVCAMNRYCTLHVAAKFGNAPLLCAALAKTPKGCVDVPSGYDGWTPLLCAVGEGVRHPPSFPEAHYACVRALVRAGANPNAVNGEALLLARQFSSELISELRAAPGRAPVPDAPAKMGEPKPSVEDALRVLCQAAETVVNVHHAKSGSPVYDAGARLIEVNACAHCGKRDVLISPGPGLSATPQLSKCARCQKVLYCNPVCQRADWRKHKPLCAAPIPPATTEASSSSRGVLNLHYLDLGKEPSEDVIAEAVRKFYENNDAGKFGADNPIPSFIDATGRRKYC